MKIHVNKKLKYRFNFNSKRLLTFPRFYSLFLLINMLFAPLASANPEVLQDTRISIKQTNVPLSRIISEIEQKTGYSIIVRLNDVDVKEKYSIDEKDKSLNQILAVLFQGQDISFEITGNTISVFKSEKRPSPASNPVHQVSGTVTDPSGEPVIGANVVEKGTTNGVITDMDGRLSLSVSGNAILQISYIGYVTQEIPVKNQTTVHITLREDSQALEEVVVVGFVTQKKANLTGAVGTVQMDQALGDRPVASLGTALQGTIAGFTAAASSAAPGSGNDWNVRGVESINGGAPLILVDNVVYNDLYQINPADIESVTVLKDASSAAIYGARASFGVILITTKKGKKNESLSINYNNNFAFSKVINTPELSSPTEFVTMLKDGGYNSIWSGQNIDTYIDVLNEYNGNPSLYPNGWTDINGTKYFLRENGIMKDMFETAWKQMHNISAQGGSERIKYRLSLGYVDEDGVLVTNKDSNKRINVASYVSGDITSWLSTSLDIRYNNSRKKYPYRDSSSQVHFWRAGLPSYHPVGTLPYGDSGEEYLVNIPSNVIELVKPEKTVTDNTRILSRTVLSPFKGFEAVLEYSYQVGLKDYESYANFFQVHQGLAESIQPSTSTTPFKTSRSTTKYTTLNAFATYNHSFIQKHNIALLAGFNQEKNDYRHMEATAYNMISNELPSLSGTDGETPPKTSDSYEEYALRSGFFRVNYDYMQKYLIEVNGRYDMSSRFPKKYRGGFSLRYP